MTTSSSGLGPNRIFTRTDNRLMYLEIFVFQAEASLSGDDISVVVQLNVGLFTRSLSNRL